jgi:hypothetical protein
LTSTPVEVGGEGGEHVGAAAGAVGASGAGHEQCALQIADALFAAVVLALTGAMFAAHVALGPAAYLAGTALAAALALAAVSAAERARMSPASLSSSPSVPNR